MPIVAPEESADIVHGQIDDGQPVTVRTGGLTAGPQLGVVIDEQSVVLEVEAGSAAEQAGVLPGDRLMTLAGVSIADQRQQAKELIWYFVAGSAPLPLTLLRNDVEMTLAIIPTPPLYPGSSDTPLPTVTPVWLPNDYF
jgi:S1-C subfamily serine protease